LGPEGGVRGGELVAQGTPEDVAATARSYTGQYLKDMLAKAAREPARAAAPAAKPRKRVSEAAE
jgi:excinuclease ABC subunit A